MTVPTRILTLLAQAPGPLCDDCLATLANLSQRQHANSTCRGLHNQAKIGRGEAACDRCGGHKLVNWPAVGTARPAPTVANTRPPQQTGKAIVPKPTGQDPGATPVALTDDGWILLRHTFCRITRIQPECDATGKVRRHYPHREGAADTTELHRHGAGPFCRFRIPAHLNHEGVYLLAEGMETRYVGRCQDLAQRFNLGYGQISPRNCYQGGQTTNCRINGEILKLAEAERYLDLWFCGIPDPGDLESRLIAALTPPWNQQTAPTSH